MTRKQMLKSRKAIFGRVGKVISFKRKRRGMIDGWLKRHPDIRQTGEDSFKLEMNYERGQWPSFIYERAPLQKHPQ